MITAMGIRLLRLKTIENIIVAISLNRCNQVQADFVSEN